ncbi:DUF6119 family protein [Aeromonas hydrophila]|uniref:DUF6119 family protein n=1 Tax=Aeromonas hydrophila TaxID=644 RepID=UPI0009B82A8C|nr:DUF6119 family protein [Aeromonas hydrophila]HDT5861455.1 TIGR04141 family sporadically distributed protein [Aeromonas hydrophila subsp. hydrophila]
MSGNKLERITIYKAKDSVKSFSFIFDVTTESLPKFKYRYKDFNVEFIIKYSEVGGAKKTEADYPWMMMVNSLDNSFNFKFSTKNKTPSAVLGLKISNKTIGTKFFLLTFGMHTSRFINLDYLVSDFGIKVAMNICDQNNLKKVNTTTHSSISTLTDRQASKGASLDIFDINDEKEFFRAISGLTYDDYPYIKSFSGKNSITINLKKSVLVSKDDLIDILLSLDNAYGSDLYKNKFPTYGRLDYVSDTDKIENLDSILFERLKDKQLSNIHLSPNRIESDDVNYYTYEDPANNPEAIRFETLGIQDLLDSHMLFTKKASINTVKHWRIYTVSTSDEISSSRAYDCLNFEVECNGTTFILSAGTWRSVNSDFKENIEQYISEKINENTNNYLPNDISIYCKVHENGVPKERYREDVYNSYVASNNKDIYLFDKSKITIAGNKQYEICDLFHSKKEFIHVKVLKSGTNSLSHLFLQARFYTDSFIKDSETRLSMRDFIVKNRNLENENKDSTLFLSLIPEKRQELHASSYSVVLCILTFDERDNIDNLPFMIKYELVKTHKYLIDERGVELSYAIRLVNKKSNAS